MIFVGQGLMKTICSTTSTSGINTSFPDPSAPVVTPIVGWWCISRCKLLYSGWKKRHDYDGLHWLPSQSERWLRSSNHEPRHVPLLCSAHAWRVPPTMYVISYTQGVWYKAGKEAVDHFEFHKSSTDGECQFYLGILIEAFVEHVAEVLIYGFTFLEESTLPFPLAGQQKLCNTWWFLPFFMYWGHRHIDGRCQLETSRWYIRVERTQRRFSIQSTLENDCHEWHGSHEMWRQKLHRWLWMPQTRCSTTK